MHITLLSRMPLTAQEKMQRYRTKLNMNTEKADLMRKKDRERKRVQKAKMSEKEKLQALKKNRERVQRHRERKFSCVASVAAGPSKSMRKVFTTPQSLEKAKQRVLRSLPKSPKKRKAILKLLADEAGIDFPKPKRKQSSVSKDFSSLNDIDG